MKRVVTQEIGDKVITEVVYTEETITVVKNTRTNTIDVVSEQPVPQQIVPVFLETVVNEEGV